MIDGRNILAVVPARGGSKGLPLKNLRLVNGLPLVAHAGKILAQIPEIDRCVVSTDHPQIAKVAAQYGLAVPFMRPPPLSGDLVSDLAVLTHALLECERLDGVSYDVIVMLQPTSPMRTVEHVRSTLEMILSQNCDSVWTVSRTDSKFHPLKQLRYLEGELSHYTPSGSDIIARQQLDDVYHRNGAAYAFTRQCLIEQKSISGKRWRAVVTEKMVSIDDADDSDLTEHLLSAAPTMGNHDLSNLRSLED